MANAGSIRFDFDVSKVLDGLDNITKAASECIRPAAQAGAEVIYKEARLRVPVSDAPHFFYGTSYKKTGVRYGPFSPGHLRDSIYQVFSEDNSVDGKRATYHVAWNHRKAPYGFMVEFGTSRAPAHPFLRPAYDAMKGLALTVANDKFAQLMEQRLAGSKT